MAYTEWPDSKRHGQRDRHIAWHAPHMGHAEEGSTSGMEEKGKCNLLWCTGSDRTVCIHGCEYPVFQMGITESSAAYTRVEEAQYGVAFAIGLVLYGVISPIAEEVVFRGIIYNRMKRCFSVKLAVPLSALLFGLYHGNTVQALYGFLLGVIIAIVYERSESFAAPVTFHAVANVTVFTVTYRNGLRDLNSAVAIGLAVALLFFAAGLGAWYLKLCKMGENKQITDK